MANALENIGLKNVSIDFLNSEIKNLFVVQGDTRTRGLLVRVKDNKGNTIPLSDEYELRLYAKRSGEDKLLYSVAERVDDKYKVYLTSDMLSKTGTLKIQLALYKGDVSLIQSRQSSIPIYPSMTCQFELGQDNVIDIVEIQESIKGLEKELEKIKGFDGLDSLADFKKSEAQRQQAEEQRVVEETTRSSNEQARVQSEETRLTNEEQRKANEQERVKAEQQRSAKDTERDVTFKNWDAKIKALSGLPEEMPDIPVLEKATETKAGIVKLKGLSEEDDTAVSYNLYNKAITDISSNTDSKLNEKEQAINAKIEEQGTKLSAHDKSIKLLETKADSISSQVTGLSTGIDEKITKHNADIDSKLEQQNTTVTEKLSEQDSKVDTKLKEYDANIEKNTTGISDINAKLSEQDKTIQGQDTKINGINEKLSTTDTDIKSLKDTTQGLTTKADELTNKLDAKATKEDINTLTTDLSSKANKSHTHAITDITNLEITLAEKASNNDLANVQANVDKKADKKHTHTTADVTDLETVLSSKASKEDIDKLSTELTEKVNSFSVVPATSEKAGTVKIDIDGQDTAVSTKTYSDKISSIENDLNSKATKEEFSQLNTTIKTKANQKDLDTLSNKMNSVITQEQVTGIQEKVDTNTKSIADVKSSLDENVESLSTQLRNKIGKEDISSLQTTLSGKADKSHKHTTSDITGLQTALDSKLEQKDISTLKTQVDTNTKDISGTKTIANANSKSISGLTNELDKKANTSHTHAISSISNLQTTLDNKVSKAYILTLQTSIDSKASKSHTHSISDISNLQTTLNGKASASDVSDLKSSIDSKASKSHTHSISDVYNLQSTLNGKASTSHSHSISDISNLQYTLNNKASSSELSNLKSKVDNLSTDKISNKNGYGNLSFWTGTQSEYDSIYYKDSNTIYFITE